MQSRHTMKGLRLYSIPQTSGVVFLEKSMALFKILILTNASTTPAMNSYKEMNAALVTDYLKRDTV